MSNLCVPELRTKPCRICGEAIEMPPNSKRVYCLPCMRKRRAAQTQSLRAKRRESIDASAGWHGTNYGYSGHSCRCEPCCAAQRAYRVAWYRNRSPEMAESVRARARELARTPDQRLRKKARQYGIEADTLASYLTDRICFACGATDVDLEVDHDHACCPSSRAVCGYCVRGLLCRDCNHVLGRVRDSKERLLHLVAYLERWELRASQ